MSLIMACACAVILAACGNSVRSIPLRVAGNHLLYGAAGKPVQLRGINRSGTEYQCVHGLGYFQSPTPDQPDSETMIAAMKRWDVDVVRIPLNEGCWLGIDVPGNDGGPSYRQAISAEVDRLNAAHLFVILSLQWAAPGDVKPTLQLPMADESHAPTFWRSVARTFKHNGDVMFDLFNEPFDIGWRCWLHGCTVPAGSGSGGSWPSYRTAGMQQLVTAVRSTGAKQPLLLGGLDYALNLSGWVAHEPKDPDHALVASAHTYGGKSPCDRGCERAILQTARHVPVVFGELGETDCGSSYIERLMAFADEHHIGYLGWAWDAGGGWTCRGGPSLITSYSGSPTPYGDGFRRHLLSLGPAVRP